MCVLHIIIHYISIIEHSACTHTYIYLAHILRYTHTLGTDPGLLMHGGGGGGPETGVPWDLAIVVYVTML